MASSTDLIEHETMPSAGEEKPAKKSRKRMRKFEGEMMLDSRRFSIMKARKRDSAQDHEFKTSISTLTVSSASRISAKFKKLELFPEISKDVVKTPQPIIPRAPTEEEQSLAKTQVEGNFINRSHGYVKVFNAKTYQVICVAEFLKIPDLSPQKREDFDYLCAFFHDCKQFVSPDALEALSSGDIASMIGWSRNLRRLEILDAYRNEKEIETNKQAYSELMERSERAGLVLWETFFEFGSVAAEKTRKRMEQLNSRSSTNNIFAASLNNNSNGSTATLGFPTNNFYQDLLPNQGNVSDAPLSFAMMIPTFKSTGKIGLQAEGHRVDHGQFVFPDIKLSIQFAPDTICRIIFRDREYNHGTIPKTEVGDSTRLGVCVRAPMPISD
ncbi:hypothetical protein PGTUg99_007566 [Puccinia graminis f. sp. tritici]|uniref:Tet-like 2OG-Fe(II) oxygenase domain-containing protein n=1 Tax=Puccinia graminis f. sp. tritici TaxID=56615 RepID=A0A5B0Q0V2_PUCGR|nr:hypothetical protein PGTUg99_007566 [Puccinia graminis f. sp. tritici]